MTVMKKIVPMLGVAMLSGAVIFGGAFANAHPSQDGDQSPTKPQKFAQHKKANRLELASQVLGISQDDLKAQLEDKTLKEIMSENGIDSKEAFQEAAEPFIREKLAEQGLSEEEIDEKLAHMQQRRQIMKSIHDAKMSALGLSREEIKDLKESGQTFEEVLSSQGFDSREDLKAAVRANLEQAWQDEGVDQETINQRLEKFDSHKKMKKGEHKGFRR